MRRRKVEEEEGRLLGQCRRHFKGLSVESAAKDSLTILAAMR